MLIPRAWERYANEPNALAAIMYLNTEQMSRVPSWTEWLSEQNSEIQNQLKKLSQ